jgi:hypothetical protein
MNNTHALEVLKMLIKTYFSDELQFDETPAGARKRMELRKAILDLSNK